MAAATAAKLPALVLPLLLFTFASCQLASCPSKQLRFIAQLSVSGCVLFVHDTGAPDGPHLVVEPVMCVTESLQGVLPRYDPITKRTYVSVAVKLRDDHMLTEAQHQLRHLSPKSLKFAQVNDVSVSTDASSAIQALGFDWIPDEASGILRLACKSDFPDCSGELLALELRCDQFNLFEALLITANVSTDCGSMQLKYRPILQNQSLFDTSVRAQMHLPTCQQLRFVRSIRLNECTARVHQRLDMKGHFLIEPLLCHNTTSIRIEPVIYDYSRDLNYLKLDVMLQDNDRLNEVMTRLSDLSPISVSFMRLWRAQGHVASVLSQRFVVSGLIVSEDGKSGQVRVYCKGDSDCKDLKANLIVNPYRLWRYIKWSVESVTEDRCKHDSPAQRYFSEGMVPLDSGDTVLRSSTVSCRMLGLSPFSKSCQLAFHSKGRTFVVIMQRTRGRVSFQQSWAKYEKGFGDETDFWIGLTSIRALSVNGATLRVEMKLWNGTRLHAEYSGFKVGDATTNYRMTYNEMVRSRSTVSFDSMVFHNGMQFSTLDRDNDGSGSSCSEDWGKGGWWFSNCYSFNPNGLFPTAENTDFSYIIWNEMGHHLSLREVRLMLLI